MYVARIKKDSLRYCASIIEKQWSSEMLSNSAEIIDSKRFFLKTNAKKWIKKRIVKILQDKKELEFNYG